MSYRFDHRHLADEMEIFCFDEKIGPGLPLWLPAGVAIRDALEAFARELERRAGYQRVSSPHLAKSELYERSGHLQCFRESMFPPLHWAEEKQDYFLRPMNCPHHHQIFAARPRSYRALPLRLAEYGQVYRYEKSGALKGLSRVRGLCQNDAHIYIERERALEEIIEVLKLHELCYDLLGLNGYRYRLSKRDPGRPEDFKGSDRDWLASEEILKQALEHLKLPYEEAAGEAAFYGPKIDVQMRMGPAPGGAEESIASVQLDFLSGERFGLSYVGRDGSAKQPWIIHRAPLGSHERFVALLLEYFDGHLPGWLAPVQVYLAPVDEGQLEAARSLARELDGLRIHVDDGSGSLSKRLALAHRLRPFAKLIIGPKEIASGRLKIQMRESVLELDRPEAVGELRRRCRSPLSDQ